MCADNFYFISNKIGFSCAGMYLEGNFEENLSDIASECEKVLQRSYLILYFLYILDNVSKRRILLYYYIYLYIYRYNKNYIFKNNLVPEKAFLQKLALGKAVKVS